MYLCALFLTRLFAARLPEFDDFVPPVGIFTEDSSPFTLPFNRIPLQCRLLDLERLPIAGTDRKNLLCPPGNAPLPHSIYLLDQSGTPRPNSQSGSLTMTSSRAYC